MRNLEATARLGLTVLLSLVAAGSLHAQLPPQAQEAIDKGVIAAKVPDYPLAIRYFEEARKLAPQAPVVYLNMGLAESRIPGRELRAIAWFGAYLAAVPDAPNAAAVREQIAVLEVRGRSNVSRLIRSAQDAAERVSGMEQSFSYLHVADLWLDFGDVKAAMMPTSLIRDANLKGIGEVRIAHTQAAAGDVAGALATIERMQVSRFKAEALVRIAEEKIEAGDLRGAKTMLASAADSAERVDKEPTVGYQTAEGVKRLLQERIAAAAKLAAGARHGPSSSAESSAATPVTVSDWLARLDDAGKGSDGALNSGPFLDLAGHLKSLPPADSPEAVFARLKGAAEMLVKAQNVIDGMLKRQARPAKP